MIISSVFVFALFGTSIAASDGHFEHRRGAGSLAALQSGLDDLAQKLDIADQTVLDFQAKGLKGVAGLLEVNAATSDLLKSIQHTTNVAKDTSPPLNAADSTAFGVAFIAVQPKIKVLLDNLVDKKHDLDKAAFGILDTRGLIHDTIVIQKSAATDLGDSIMKAIDPSLEPIAKPLIEQVQANFTVTIDQFKGRSGCIKIPPKAVPKLSKLLDKLAGAVGLDPGKDAPKKGHPDKGDGGKGDPGNDDPGKGDPGKGDPGKDDPSKGDPSKSIAGVGNTGGANASDGANKGQGNPRGVDPGKGDPGRGVAKEGKIVASVAAVDDTTGYCCGLTQERLDSLGPDEEAVELLPLPVMLALRTFGMI